MRKPHASGIVRRAAFGAAAGAVGTVAMDLVLFRRYRRGDGTDSLWRWEFAGAVTSWEAASAPAQIGLKLERLVRHSQPPDSWARATTNVVHWATGIGWGLQYGVLARRYASHPLIRGVSLGPVIWLSSYAILPLAGVYEPIWKYDARTLLKDLSAHVVYGLITSAVFATIDPAKP